MRFGLIWMAFLSGLMAASAQAISETDIKKKFEGQDYQLLTRYEQLLNADIRPDLILIFGKKNEETLSTPDRPLRRIFVLATGTPDNKYTIVAENKNVIYYYNYDANFKETFVDITFEKRKFTVNHYGGFERRWGKATTFTFSPKDNDWFFERDEIHVFMASDPELEIEKKLVTAKKGDKISIKSFDIYTEWK